MSSFFLLQGTGGPRSQPHISSALSFQVEKRQLLIKHQYYARWKIEKKLLVGLLHKYWNRFAVGITASLVDMHNNRKDKLLRSNRAILHPTSGQDNGQGDVLDPSRLIFLIH